MLLSTLLSRVKSQSAVLCCYCPWQVKLTSDVGAVQQRLQSADLLQQRSLGKQEVLLCGDNHTTASQ